VKEATYVAAMKKAIDDAAAQKAVDDAAVAEKAAEETITPRAIEAETLNKAAEEPVGSSSPLVLAVGAKRVTTPGGSIPPTKQFRGSWKPRYAERLFSYCWFFSFSFVLCLTGVSLSRVSTTGRTPTPVGPVARGAPGTDGAQDATKDRELQDPLAKTTHGDGTPIQEVVPKADSATAAVVVVSSSMGGVAVSGPVDSTGLTATLPSSPP
jgi:hypothetical protein